MKAEEVARLGGVSRSTVSRVINNYSNVPEETREKVLRVVRETNYVPNTSARILAGKGTDTIGLFIFNVHDDTRPGRIYGNSYFGPFVNAVVDRCNNRGYSVLIHTLYRSKDCRRIPTAWNEKRIDGAIIIGTERDEDIERLIAQTDCPLAIADYNPKTVARLAAPTARLLTVNSDDDAGMEACVRHLAELGHRDIGLVTGRLNTWSGERRLKAFKGSMKTLGLTVRAKWMPHGDFSYRRTAEAVQAMIADGKLPTALIASNDDMALAAIETFRNAGIQVPEDISVIGYDDGLAAPLVHPALTTVRVPFFDMASRAVEGLVKLLEGGKPAVESATLPVTLVRRATCGAPRAHQVMTREPSQA
jgi:LacI family transcriptional regulator